MVYNSNVLGYKLLFKRGKSVNLKVNTTKSNFFITKFKTNLQYLYLKNY